MRRAVYIVAENRCPVLIGTRVECERAAKALKKDNLKTHKAADFELYCGKISNFRVFRNTAA